MSATFRQAQAFNGDISKWDVSSATTMVAMFNGAKVFNGDISKWDVSRVTDMTGTFREAQAFNRDISKWDVSKVINMIAMFKGAKAFNRNLRQWDVSSVTDMRETFSGAERFNGDISKWDTSKVTNMGHMFFGAKAFNRDISRWQVQSVTDMSSMFSGAKMFNGDIWKWQVSKVTDMSAMFYGATRFNGDIYRWDVRKVTTMRDMFNGAIAFNADISKWVVMFVTDMSDMFTNAKSFVCDLSRWNLASLTSVVRIHGGTGPPEATGRLEWELVNYRVEHKGKSNSKLDLIPGPGGGINLAGTIESDDAPPVFCVTTVNRATPPLGFSSDTVALRLEVTGDGHRYRLGLREKDGIWPIWRAPVWEAEFDTKPGVRTEVVLPLDKATWHETRKGLRVDGGKIPDWSQMRGVSLVHSPLDLDGRPSSYSVKGPFEVTIHSMEMLNRDTTEMMHSTTRANWFFKIPSMQNNVRI